MMYRAFIILGTLTLAVSLSAFAQAPSPQPPAPAAAAPPPEEPPPPLAVSKDYRYNPRGRRDPFVNPVPKPVQAQRAAVVPPSARPDGPRGVLIAEVTVAGIVSSREPSMNVVT